MDLIEPPELQDFRAEVREWLATNVPRDPLPSLDTAAGLPEFVPVSAEGWVRILPGLLEAEGGLDGFFMARLVPDG